MISPEIREKVDFERISGRNCYKGEFFFLWILVCCHSKTFRNLFSNPIMHTICPHDYHYNVLIGIPELGHSMHGLFMAILYLIY